MPENMRAALACRALCIAFALAILFAVGHAATINSFSINNGAEYTNSPVLNLSINAVATEMRFSCNNTDWTPWLQYSASARFNLEPSYGCTLSDGNKTVYIEVRDSQGSASDSSRIVLDSKHPSTPSALVVSLSDSIAKVSWGASSDSSGISRYDVRVRDYGKEMREIIVTVSGYETSFQHPVRKRRKYCYAVMAYDNAGNSSQYSKEQCIITAEKGPDLNIAVFDSNMHMRDFNGMRYFHDETIFIKAIPESDINDINGYIVQGQEKNILVFSKLEDAYVASHTLMPLDGNATVYITATDYLGLSTTRQVSFFVDSTEPEIHVVSLKQDTEATLLLKAKVSGDTAKLYVNYSSHQYVFETEMSDADKEIEAHLDINDVEQETIKINLTAIDRAGNSTSVSIDKVLFLNPITKIKDVETLADFIRAKVDSAKELALLAQPDVEHSIDDANAMIAEAIQSIESGDYEGAKQKLAEAKSVLELASTKLASISTLQRYEIDYNAEKPVFYSELASYLKEVPADTKMLWESLAIKREILFLEIKKLDGTSYAVVVLISLKNSTSKKIAPFWIVEYIPKTITSDFAMLSSNTVLQQRPESNIVEIPVKELNPNELAVVRYSSRPMSKQEYEMFKLELSDFYVPVPTSEKNLSVSFVHHYERPNLLPLAIIIFLVAFAYILYRRTKR